MPEIEGEKHIVLETYRRDGTPVRTPVWFVLHDGLVCVVTREHTGKVKRLCHTQKVRVAACTMRGSVTGQWQNGVASKVPDDRVEQIVRLRDKKYGFMARVAKFASRGKGKAVAYSITLQADHARVEGSK